MHLLVASNPDVGSREPRRIWVQLKLFLLVEGVGTLIRRIVDTNHYTKFMCACVCLCVCNGSSVEVI